MKKQKYHYVYRITNLILKKHYYGSRSSIIPPQEDLGGNYFSSSSDKDFKRDQQLNPSNYKYCVVRTFNNRQEALLFESHLHWKFNVANNVNFYNKSNVTSTGFIYGFLGKKHTPESRKLAIQKKVQTMKTTVNTNNETLYNLAAKKGSITKLTTITEDGLNIHQVAAKKYKALIDTVRVGDILTTREKLKQPKTDKTNYQKIPDHINIYDNEGKLIYEVRIPLKTFCSIQRLPYTALYESKRTGNKLYYNITNPQIISVLNNKGYYKFLNWSAKVV